MIFAVTVGTAPDINKNIKFRILLFNTILKADVLENKHKVSLIKICILFYTGRVESKVLYKKRFKLL